MKAWIVCICFLSALFIACSGKDNIPSDVLSKAAMQKVLWDLIRADKYSTMVLNKDSVKNIKAERIQLYEQVFRLHHITKDKFQKSYNFYLSRPDIAKVIFDSLSASADRKRPDVYAKPAFSDSVKRKIEIGKPK
jgi:Domain of unknown function (DUF4296)